MLVHRFVWQLGAFVGSRIHAQRRAVNDNVVLGNHLGRYIVISDGVALACRAANETRFQAKAFQSVVDGLGRTACSEDECLLMARFEHRLYAARKADNVAVKAF